MIGIICVSMVGCDFLAEEDGDYCLRIDSVNPPKGSIIRPGTTITVTFCDEPITVTVFRWTGENRVPVRVRVSGNTATIRGPFPRGILQLGVEWWTWELARKYPPKDAGLKRSDTSLYFVVE